MKIKIALGYILCMLTMTIASNISLHSSGRYFQNGTTPIYFQGFQTWSIPVHGQLHDQPTSYHKQMDTMATHGLNFIRIKIVTNRFDNTTIPQALNGPTSIPYAASSKTSVTLNSFDNTFWSGLAEQLHYARSRNIYVLVSLFDGASIRGGSEANRWGNSMFNKDNHAASYIAEIDKNNNNSADELNEFYSTTSFDADTGIGKYQRNLIDKVISTCDTFDNIFYEVGNETFGADNRWYNAVISYMKSKTTKAVTTNPMKVSNATRRLQNAEGSHDHSPSTLADIKTTLQAITNRGFAAWVDLDNTHEVSYLSTADYRTAIWYSFTCGAAVGCSFQRDHLNGRAYNPLKLDMAKNILDFIDKNSITYFEMVPTHELVSNNAENSCLSNVKTDYVVYIKNDATVTVDISAIQGIAYYKTYNPVDGSYSAEKIVSNSNSAFFSRPNSIPSGQDWVLLIYTKSQIAKNSAPTNIRFTAESPSKINVTWNDNSTNETGFKIYQNTSNTKPKTPLFIANANATFWSNTDLTANTLYYYWIESYNSSGVSNPITGSQTTPESSKASLMNSSSALPIINGGFETDLIGWTTEGTRSFAFKHSGTASLLFSKNKVASQTLTGLQPNSTYTVTAWTCNSSDVVTDHGILQVANYGGTTITKTGTAEGKVWEQLTVQFTTDSRGTSATVTLTRQNAGYDYIYFDLVQ